MKGINQGNRNTINLLPRNVSHTRPTTIQTATQQQVATLLPKKNQHKRTSYNLTAVFGLIKVLIEQLASPSQKEKGKTLNHSQKQGKGNNPLKEHSPHKTQHFAQPQPQLSSSRYSQHDGSNIPPRTALQTKAPQNNNTTDQTLENTYTAQQMFELNKEKWRQSGIKNYFYTFQRSCFCTRDATREVLTHVRNGAAVMSQFKDSGLPLPDTLSLNKLSVNDLFTTIEKALDRRADVIQVKYDHQTGQPTSIYIDAKTGLTDDEFSLIARNLTTS